MSIYTAPPVASVPRRSRNSSALRFAPRGREESETVIILADAAPDVAHVWTSQPHLARRLLRDHPEALTGRHDDDRGRITGLEFDLPIGSIRLRKGPRSLSDRQRAVLERARAISRRGALARSSLRAQGSEV